MGGRKLVIDPAVISLIILTYLLVLLLGASEMVPLSIAALVGALLTAWFGLTYGVFAYNEALGFIDMRVLALILGTMIVVEVAYRSGLFRFAALYAIRLSRGSPRVLFMTMCIVAAGASLFLSDQTAMLLIAATATTMAKIMNLDPTPYFVSAAMMINLGGTSTFIGSVSNMIIGVSTGLTFTDFISYMAAGEIALWGITIAILYYLYRSRLGEKKPLPRFDPWEGVENRKLFNRSTIILIVFLILFLTYDRFGVGPEAVALGCAVLALTVSGFDPSEIFKRIDWETIFFLGGFYFIVGGLQKTGVLEQLSQSLLQATAANPLNATILTLWTTGALSAVVSNMAVALTFTPILRGLKGLNDAALSSALVFGTNLGGATTPLSGSVVIMALGALKREGISVSFREFTKVGVITSLAQMGFATLYLIARFGLVI